MINLIYKLSSSKANFLQFLILIREKKYDIEGENLEGKYKEWQKKLHPDLVHSKSQVGLMESSFFELISFFPSLLLIIYF